MNHLDGHTHRCGRIVAAVVHWLVNEMEEHMPALALRKELKVRLMLIGIDQRELTDARIWDHMRTEARMVRVVDHGDGRGVAAVWRVVWVAPVISVWRGGVQVFAAAQIFRISQVHPLHQVHEQLLYGRRQWVVALLIDRNKLWLQAQQFSQLGNGEVQGLTKALQV